MCLSMGASRYTGQSQGYRDVEMVEKHRTVGNRQPQNSYTVYHLFLKNGLFTTTNLHKHNLKIL